MTTAATREDPMTTRHRHRTATAALAAVALLALAGCTQDDAPAGGSSTTASTPPPPSSTSTAATTGLTDTAAYAQADKNYRAWVQLSDQACNASNGRPAYVAPTATKVATRSAIRTSRDDTDAFFMKRTPDDTVVRTTCTTTVRSTKGLELRRQDPVSPWTLSLGVCRETSGEVYNAAGKDIALPQKGVQNGVVLLRSEDKGKTWLVDDESNLNNPTREDSCKY